MEKCLKCNKIERDKNEMKQKKSKPLGQKKAQQHNLYECNLDGKAFYEII